MSNKKVYRKINARQDRFAFYVSENTGEKIRDNADKRGVSLSFYLAGLVKDSIKTE